MHIYMYIYIQINISALTLSFPWHCTAWITVMLKGLLVLLSSPVAYWAPTDPGAHLYMPYLFAYSYCSWGSRGESADVVCHPCPWAGLPGSNYPGMRLSRSARLGDMPSILTVPLLVPAEHLNLH